MKTIKRDDLKRPCWGGVCSDRGVAEPGFCQCKADAEEILKLKKDLALARRWQAHWNVHYRQLQEEHAALELRQP